MLKLIRYFQALRALYALFRAFDNDRLEALRKAWTAIVRRKPVSLFPGNIEL
jgi:hypothetical protein